MKSFNILIVFLFIFSSSLLAQDNMANNIDNSNIALQGYSPVSYLDLGIAQKGLQAFKSEYEKVLYYFTSAEQKAAFDADPKKYLPQYGGYCAYAIGLKSKKVGINPETFEIRDGKLYLFYNSFGTNTLDLWNQENPEALRDKADENWEKIKNK